MENLQNNINDNLISLNSSWKKDLTECKDTILPALHNISKVSLDFIDLVRPLEPSNLTNEFIEENEEVLINLNDTVVEFLEVCLWFEKFREDKNPSFDLQEVEMLSKEVTFSIKDAQTRMSNVRSFINMNLSNEGLERNVNLCADVLCFMMTDKYRFSEVVTHVIDFGDN